jgi:hypothetical protein
LAGRFLQAFAHGEAADLLGHFFVAALGAGGRASGIHALRQEAENPPALWTGKFVNRHWDLRFTIYD